MNRHLYVVESIQRTRKLIKLRMTVFRGPSTTVLAQACSNVSYYSTDNVLAAWRSSKRVYQFFSIAYQARKTRVSFVMKQLSNYKNEDEQTLLAQKLRFFQQTLRLVETSLEHLLSWLHEQINVNAETHETFEVLDSTKPSGPSPQVTS